MVRDTQGNQQVVKTVRNLALNTFLVCGASFIEVAATVWLAVPRGRPSTRRLRTITHLILLTAFKYLSFF